MRCERPPHRDGERRGADEPGPVRRDDREPLAGHAAEQPRRHRVLPRLSTSVVGASTSSTTPDSSTTREGAQIPEILVPERVL